jgi:hypothetical protein
MESMSLKENNNINNINLVPKAVEINLLIIITNQYFKAPKILI